VWPKEIKTLKSLLNEREYDTYISSFIDAQVLYIDDFLKQRQGTAPTCADMNIAFEILNARLHSPDKITIISSELTFDKLLSYDEGAISRIAEMTGEFMLNIRSDSSKNYRLKSIW
jgi:DNA replication protein DnaC